MRAEIRKLTTARATWLLLAIAQFIVVAGVSGLMLQRDDPAFKAAVLQHASGLGHSLAPKGIRVNTVSPGPIDFPDGAWDNLHKNRPEYYDMIQGRIPLGRRGVPEDVAPWIVALAGGGAAWVTGQVITVDGGLDAT